MNILTTYPKDQVIKNETIENFECKYRAPGPWFGGVYYYQNHQKYSQMIQVLKGKSDRTNHIYQMDT